MAVYRFDPTLRAPHRKTMKLQRIIMNQTLRDMFAKHEDFTRKGLMRSAMDVLVRRKHREDLTRIRLAIDEEAVDFESSDVAFFHRWGEWEDIQRIDLMARGYRFAGGSAFSLFTLGSSRSLSEGLEEAARAIIKISGERIEDVLHLDIQPTLLKKIIQLMPYRHFRELSLSSINIMINHSVETIRKVSCLRILNCFPKSWCINFLERYTKSERYRYYNVLFWLDLCEGFDVRTFRRIATNELDRMS